MIPNMTSAMLPRIATRNASWGDEGPPTPPRGSLGRRRSIVLIG
jgi:hypothetical protein